MAAQRPRRGSVLALAIRVVGVRATTIGYRLHGRGFRPPTPAHSGPLRGRGYPARWSIVPRADGRHPGSLHCPPWFVGTPHRGGGRRDQGEYGAMGGLVWAER